MDEKKQVFETGEIFTPDRILSDIGRGGRDRDWRGRKVRNELLALAYDGVDAAKAARLRGCGQYLEFVEDAQGNKRLTRMTSCRVRLCPICSWRRSLKVYAQTKEIVDYIAGQSQDYRYIMLTLTVRNCTGDELNATLDNLLGAWNRLVRLDAVARAAKGWYRSLEVVHDVYPVITPEMYHGDTARHIKSRKKWYDAHGYGIGDANPNYDMFHPHIHALLVVNKSYPTGRDYISQRDWAAMWRQSLRVNYNPRVDVRFVAGETMEQLNKAVCEVAKYACKDSDYIVPDDWDLTVATVRMLNDALAHRRLVAYGGVMRRVKQMLKQDDVDSGNLVDVGDADQPELVGDTRTVRYWWYSGYRQYYEI